MDVNAPSARALLYLPWLVAIAAVAWALWLLLARDRDPSPPPSGNEHASVPATPPAQAAATAQAAIVPEPPAPTESPRVPSAAHTLPDGQVWVAPGEVLLGSPTAEVGREPDEAQHRVVISRGFLLDAYEVTQSEWARHMTSAPSFFSQCGPRCPVERVNWYEALAFANTRSRDEGLEPCYVLDGCLGVLGSGAVKGSGEPLYGIGDFHCADVGVRTPSGRVTDCTGYRLPTGAEWELTARGGTDAATYAGDIVLMGRNRAPALEPIAWYAGNSAVDYAGGVDCAHWPERSTTAAHCGVQEVGGRLANAWGAYDLLGNVWEWTWDHYAHDAVDQRQDPEGPAEGEWRVFRGGSWGSGPLDLRVANRVNSDPAARAHRLGFRLVRTWHHDSPPVTP